jgi:phosphoadenosine phosphosulfate reductase
MYRAAELAHALQNFDEGFVAEEVVEWAAATFGDGLVVQTSAGTQASVMLNLVTRIVPDVKVVFVDTGYLPKETTEYMATLKEELNLNLTVARPRLSPDELEAEHGRLWETDHERYGHITKVEPMNRALEELGCTAILSGLRGGQTETRAGLSKVSFDLGSQRFKILPILDWTKQDVQHYQKTMMLPRHPLQAKGFATVGDAHSSRALRHGETDERATRFGGKTQECGLHTQTIPLKQFLVELERQSAPLPSGFVLFTKPNCKYCKAAKALLGMLGHAYVERDISVGEVRAEMQLHAPGAKTVPQVFQDGAHLGGFEDLHARMGCVVAADEFVKQVQESEERTGITASCSACHASMSAGRRTLHCAQVACAA